MVFLKPFLNATSRMFNKGRVEKKFVNSGRGRIFFRDLNDSSGGRDGGRERISAEREGSAEVEVAVKVE